MVASDTNCFIINASLLYKEIHANPGRPRIEVDMSLCVWGVKTNANVE